METLRVNYRKVAVTLAIGAFLTLAVGSALTHRPQIDEGMFADPARNLATNGSFATTSLETDKSPLLRIEQRTYWVMPLFLLNVAASFKAFGVSLVSMRLVSVFWGLVLLAAVYLIAWKIARDRLIAALALVLAAGDYMVLETASSGRMDMMSAALSFAAIAAYLSLRERNLNAAVFGCHTLLVLSGLTHPNAIMALVGVVFLTLYFDRKNFGLRQLALAAVPYVVGGTAFGLWVMQDVEAFRAQFIDNATMGGRMQGFSSPFSNIIREFTERYPHAYGLQATSSGHSGPVFLKGLILVGYLAGVAGMAAIADLRRRYMPLIVVAAIFFLILAIIDGQKQTTYLIHIVPIYAVFLAAVCHWIWNSKKMLRVPLATGLACYLILQTGGMALRIKQNTYGNFYRPMIAYLNENAGNGELVMGGSELIFGVSPAVRHVADGRFGYLTGKRPVFIVYDSAVENSWEASKTLFPAFYEYFPRLLREEYQVAYENAAYKVYRRRAE